MRTNIRRWLWAAAIAGALTAALLASLLATTQPAGAQANKDDLPEFAPVSLPTGVFAERNGLSQDDVIVTRIANVELLDFDTCALALGCENEFDEISFSVGDTLFVVWLQGGGVAEGYLVTIAGGLTWRLDLPLGAIPGNFRLLEDQFLLPGGLPASGSGGLAEKAPGAGFSLAVASIAALAATLVALLLRHTRPGGAPVPGRRRFHPRTLSRR